jgi:hypothetical protein
MKCLDHRDPSIRQRALDIAAWLVDERYIEALVPHVVAYVHLAGRDFRRERIAKVFRAVQRFAPSL